MKKHRFFLIFLILPMLLSAQVRIDENLLPELNETYRTLIDNMPRIDLKKQGGNQFWDFSTISSGLSHETTLSAEAKSAFRINFDYDFVRTDASGWIHYYKRRNQNLYEVALERPHPLNSATVVLAHYEVPLLEMYAPLRYNNELTNRSLIEFKLSKEEIPKIINRKLPITADSIKVIYNETRDFRVDAWGTLALYYDRYDVLRQEISSLTSISMEVYTAGKWSKINNNILDPAGDLLGTSFEKHYVFYSDTENEPIAKVKLDVQENPVVAEIKAPDNAGEFVSANTTKQELILSPNPTYGDIKLELMNLDYGKYKFEVFNILSKKLWGEDIVVDRKLSSHRYNFEFLGKGTYLWAITNSQGVRITTKRLVVITP